MQGTSASCLCLLNGDLEVLDSHWSYEGNALGTLVQETRQELLARREGRRLEGGLPGFPGWLERRVRAKVTVWTHTRAGSHARLPARLTLGARPCIWHVFRGLAAIA